MDEGRVGRLECSRVDHSLCILYVRERPRVPVNSRIRELDRKKGTKMCIDFSTSSSNGGFPEVTQQDNYI